LRYPHSTIEVRGETVILKLVLSSDVPRISWKTVLIFCLHSHWNARAKGRPPVRYQLRTWTASGTASLSVLLLLLLVLLLLVINMLITH